MNAGMYGMANGQGMAGRKFIGRVGVLGAVARPAYPVSYIAMMAGRTGTTVTLAANTRTLVFSASGAGALRACALEATGIGIVSLTIEVVIDGVRALSVNHASVDGNSSQGITAFGGINGSVTSLDFVPFTSSCEVYFTSSGAGSHSSLVVADLYQ